MRFIPFEPSPRIAGSGVLTPAGDGVEALASRREPGPPPGDEVGLDLAAPGGISTAGYRRGDRYGALGLAAARRAFAGACVEPPVAANASWGIMIGSSLGCWAANARFLDELRHRPMTEVSPALFARTASSAATRDISLAFNLAGPCETFVSGWTAGIDALVAAGVAVAEGRAGWMLAGAIEAPGDRFKLMHTAVRRRAGCEWLPERMAEGAACVLLGPDEANGMVRLRAYSRVRDPEQRWSLGAALDELRPLAIQAVIVANSIPPGVLTRWRAEAAGRSLIDLPCRAGELGAAGSIAACALAGMLNDDSVLVIARGMEGNIAAVALSR